MSFEGQMLGDYYYIYGARALKKFSKYSVYAMEMMRHAPRGRILLGSADPEFSTEPITIPALKQFNITILGHKGSGKSVMMSNIFHQLFKRFDTPTFVIDPKWEFHTHYKPQTDRKLNKIMRNYGLKPEGLPLFVCTPKMAVDKYEKKVAGYVYQLDLKDFKRLRPSTRYALLLQFFNLTSSDQKAPQRQLLRYIQHLPDHFDKFIKQLKNETNVIYHTKGGKAIKRRRTVPLLDSLLSFSLSDAIGSTKSLFIPERMAYKNGKAKYLTIMQLGDMGEDTRELLAYLKIALFDVISERTKAKRIGRGRLKKPISIFIDEVDLFAPGGKQFRYSPVKSTIEQLYTKYRAMDISTVVATQFPDQISEALISQADYVIVSKLFAKGERDMLRWRGMDKDTIESLFGKLHYQMEDPIKEKAIIYPDSSFETFYPFPSPSAFQVQKLRYHF